MSGDREKKYDAVFFEKDLDGRPKASNVYAVEDAKEVSACTTVGKLTLTPTL